MNKYFLIALLVAVSAGTGYVALKGPVSSGQAQNSNTESASRQSQVDTAPTNIEVPSVPTEEKPAPVKLATADTPTQTPTTFKTTRTRDHEEREDDDDDYRGAPATTVAPTNTAPAPATQNTGSAITLATVAKHNTETSCYSAINGKVYDFTSFINKHPGGRLAVVFICGKDGTSGFMGQHAKSQKAQAALAPYMIGTLAQ